MIWVCVGRRETHFVGTCQIMWRKACSSTQFGGSPRALEEASSPSPHSPITDSLTRCPLLTPKQKERRRRENYSRGKLCWAVDGERRTTTTQWTSTGAIWGLQQASKRGCFVGDGRRRSVPACLLLSSVRPFSSLLEINQWGEEEEE